MPNLVIRKIEELSEKEKVENGLHFRNRQKEMFDWENEEYENTQAEPEREVAFYLDTAAKLPGIELEGQKDLKEFGRNVRRMRMKIQQNLREIAPWTMSQI